MRLPSGYTHTCGLGQRRGRGGGGGEMYGLAQSAADRLRLEDPPRRSRYARYAAGEAATDHLLRGKSDCAEACSPFCSLSLWLAPTLQMFSCVGNLSLV